MTPLFHAIVFLSYLILAGIVVITLPLTFPGATESLGLAMGGVVVLVGALIHMAYAFFESRRRLRAEIIRLRTDQSLFVGQQARADGTAQLILDAGTVPPSGPPSGPPPKPTAKDKKSQAEERVRKHLVSRLFKGTASPEKKTASRSSKKPRVKRPPEKKDPQEKKRPGKSAGKSKKLQKGKQRQEPRIVGTSDHEDSAVIEIVTDALNAGRVDLMLQPIVTLPQRRLNFFECFSRVRTENSALLPQQYLQIAERKGLIAAIDNMLLFRCVQLVRKNQRAHRGLGFFCNISTYSLADEDFFGEFISYLLENAELAPSLIFEFAQNDMAQLDGKGLENLEQMSNMGFRFSIDQVTRLDMNFDEIASRRVKFVKVPIALLLREAKNKGDLAGLKETFDLLNMDIIAERIEDDDSLLQLLDQPIHLGQGYLLGKPRISRESA